MLDKLSIEEKLEVFDEHRWQILSYNEGSLKDWEIQDLLVEIREFTEDNSFSVDDLDELSELAMNSEGRCPGCGFVESWVEEDGYEVCEFCRYNTGERFEEPYYPGYEERARW